MPEKGAEQGGERENSSLITASDRAPAAVISINESRGAPYSLSREADRAGEASALPVRVSAAARHPSSLSFVPLGQLGCSDVPRLRRLHGACPPAP